MPRSRASTPDPEPDISNSFVPGLTLTHDSPSSVDNNTNNINNSNNSNINNSNINNNGNKTSPVRKKHKYIKPRLGTSFQAKVEAFDDITAKRTIQIRQEGKKKGLCGYIHNNTDLSSVVGGEYGTNGGIFASVSSKTKSANGGGGYGSGNGGNGRRKRAGRPPKSARVNKAANLFQNNQPIYYNANIPPPIGGLCVHHPLHHHHHRNDNHNNTNNNNKTKWEQQHSHDEFLTFARNLILQSPITREEELQCSGQYTYGNSNLYSFQRTDYSFNNMLQQDGNGDGGGMAAASIINAKIEDGTSNNKRGRKRKIDTSKTEENSIPLLSSTSNNNNGIVTSANNSSFAQGANVKKETETKLAPKQDIKSSENDFGIVNSPHQQVTLGLENDEVFLEYLQTNHKGNIEHAKFNLLSELCRGRATKTRRYHKKLKKDDELDLPLSAVLAPLSDSWRRRYERVRSSSIMVGDLRKQTKSTLMQEKLYPYFDTQKTFADRCKDNEQISPAHFSSSLYPWQNTSFSVDDESYDPKLDSHEENQRKSMSSWGNEDAKDYLENNTVLAEQWKSILKYGQSAIAQFHKNTDPVSSIDSTKLPKIGDLLILLGKAYVLPKPEDVFGRRDSISKQISQCLNSILEKVEIARCTIASLYDSLYDNNNEGIDLNKIKKVIEQSSSRNAIHVTEIGVVQGMIDEAFVWESKLNYSPSGEDDDDDSSASVDLHLPQQSLFLAEELALKGRSLSLYPKSLFDLDDRIQRAYDLRNRIRDWSSNNDTNDKDNVKYVASMIKEANQINLGFPELSVLSKVHRSAEEWVDRASVALRSKISLHELESLVNIGRTLPLGLTGTLDKLTLRLESACEWVDELKKEIPCPCDSMTSYSDIDANVRVKWLLKMLETIKNGGDKMKKIIVDLAAEGSKLPVEINALQLLQVAIDSRNWSLKAKKWIPNSCDQFRRGKIDDLRDHLESAEVIVKKANMLTDDKSNWNFEYQKDVSLIVTEADEWYDKYEQYIDSDNRKTESRQTVSFAILQDIVHQANKIPANLGNVAIKMNRMYSEAKPWIDQFKSLLVDCCISLEHNDNASSQTLKPKVSLEVAKKAVDVANNDLSVDLEEAKLLTDLVNQSEKWFDRALEFAPKRNKRVTKGKRDSQEKHSIEEVISLINDAPSIPMDTTEDAERLRILLSQAKSWRLQAQVTLREISNAFGSLREERSRYYGSSETYLLCENSDTNVENGETHEKLQAEEENSTQLDTEETSLRGIPNSSGVNVYKMIINLVKSAEDMSISSIEEDIAKDVDIISRWCKKAALLIGSHTDVYTNTRTKKNLDDLISNGELLKERGMITCADADFEEKNLLQTLKSNVTSFIDDDIGRLKILRIHRDNYYAWCDKVNKAYTESDKKLPLEELKKLANESLVYPQNADTVKQIRADASNAEIWVKSVADIIQSDIKFSLEEAKSKLEAGNRLKFTCSQYKELRASYLGAKAWSKRVKKSGLDDGSAQIYKIKELIQEHDSFIIGMPEELEALNQALCAYCICRRPYEGFMIGCDNCEEWYHGPCVGVSQAQGTRIDKYVCVRCSVKKAHMSSCNNVATVIRKWFDPKEMSKARSSVGQKHQRKVREKKREVTKLEEEIELNTVNMKNLKAEGNVLMDGPTNMSHLPINTAAMLPLQTSVPQAAEQDSIGNHVSDKIQLTNSNFAKAIVSFDKIQLTNANIAKAKISLEQCNRRLKELAAVAKVRKASQEQEDRLKDSFRYWCMLVRTKVLTPETDVDAEKGRPVYLANCKKGSDLLSVPMLEVLGSASKYGIEKFPDIAVVRHSLECISWCHFALTVLMKKPKIEEVKALIDLSAGIKLPEAKSIGMMRSMVNRTASWQAKFNKVLLPVTGESQPFEESILTELRMSFNSVPLAIPEEYMLIHTVEDRGARHCKCGSARDVRTMICCEHCTSWYHLSCYSIPNNSDTFKCPLCKKPSTAKLSAQKEPTDNISPHAPDPKSLWPPYGLANSPDALKALGTSPLAFKVENMREPNQQTFQGNPVLGKKQNIAAKLNGITTTNQTPQVSCKTQFVCASTPIASLEDASNYPTMTLQSPTPQLFNTVEAPQSTVGSQISNFKVPYYDTNAVLNSRDTVEGLKAALKVNSIQPILDQSSIIDEKAAAEVAALAQTVLASSGVMNNSLNGFKSQSSAFGKIESCQTDSSSHSQLNAPLYISPVTNIQAGSKLDSVHEGSINRSEQRIDTVNNVVHVLHRSDNNEEAKQSVISFPSSKSSPTKPSVG